MEAQAELLERNGPRAKAKVSKDRNSNWDLALEIAKEIGLNVLNGAAMAPGRRCKLLPGARLHLLGRRVDERIERLVNNAGRTLAEVAQDLILAYLSRHAGECVCNRRESEGSGRINPPYTFLTISPR